MWPDHRVPIWKIPFPNHPGPTSVAILPHKEQRAIYCKNHQRQCSNTKFRHEELPPLEHKTKFRMNKNKISSPSFL